MIYTPQKYTVADERMKSFIHEGEIESILARSRPDKGRVREVIARSLGKNRLTLEETAVLVAADDEESVQLIKEGAKKLKQDVYGKRIVLFAPLYIGNYCTNNCQYCGFKTDNKDQTRLTLSEEEIKEQTRILENEGQKRLILVFGEHPVYSPEFIAGSVRTVYSVKEKNGEIRRVNINAAPQDIEGFKVIKEAGIGTYQVFQESYHRETYLKYHKSGKKRNYDWRLTALDRAQEAGIDDVGIGVLLGLYDWRFELLALVRHVNHFEAAYNVGPHTISFPRIKNAAGFNLDDKYKVSDDDFKRFVAILRLAVPYTGLILTAREPASLRKEILEYGISQIDGGTNIQMKGYGRKNGNDLNQEQFKINDDRSLSEVINELVEGEYLPSFCTACYRLGRTGEHFMEFSTPGFIKRFCQPNAMLTLAEYLEDYATPEVKRKGFDLILNNLETYNDEQFKGRLIRKLNQIKEGKRDLYF